MFFVSSLWERHSRLGGLLAIIAAIVFIGLFFIWVYLIQDTRGCTYRLRFVTVSGDLGLFASVFVSFVGNPGSGGRKKAWREGLGWWWCFGLLVYCGFGFLVFLRSRSRYILRFCLRLTFLCFSCIAVSFVLFWVVFKWACNISVIILPALCFSVTLF